jgi:hypothetical protein
MTNRSDAIAIFLMCIFLSAAQLAVNPSCTAVPSMQIAKSQQLPVMDAQPQIALVLSSCAPSVVSKAAVYALDRFRDVELRVKGFELRTPWPVTLPQPLINGSQPLTTAEASDQRP